MTINVALCTLCLNESEFLAKSYEQHREWPGMVSWVFVEAADPKYAEANPAMVSTEGLSVDQTCPIITSMVNADPRVQLIRHGWMIDANPAQAKTRGRDRYLDVLESVEPDYFVVMDADEFYSREDQARINQLIEQDANRQYLCWRLLQRHIWRPYSICKAPRFELEVIGAYWHVKHVRIFRWQHGIRYRTDHNYPTSALYQPLRHLYEGSKLDPQCIHLGFARGAAEREATNRYYQQRGEGLRDGRASYVTCRRAWEYWKPDKRLPDGAQVLPYEGTIPECFNDISS